MEKLSFQADKDLIIPRALLSITDDTFNTEIEKLEQVYSPDEIISTLKKTTERISNHLCLLVANKYHIDPFYRYSL